MFKRIWLFILTNIAIIAVITIMIFIVERVFWISVSWWPWSSYTSIFVYSAIVWFAWAFISLFISRWIAKKTYKITLITPKTLDTLSSKEFLVWETVERLANSNNIKMPEVGIYEDSEPNAFATGATKNSSLVCISTGLLENMNNDAIEWVVGHEMAHVLNWDMVTMTLLQWVVNTFVIFAARILSNIFDNITDWKFWTWGYLWINILLQILFWVLASLITSKFSRYREFRADEWSAKFLGKEKMIAWLQALKNMQNYMHESDPKLASMQIASKKKWWIMMLFSTHPDLDDRIKALEEMKI
jgi:heat shock protein HtpX